MKTGHKPGLIDVINIWEKTGIKENINKWLLIIFV
jgi:hypothetical protein